MTIIVPLLAALLGAVIYIISSHAKAAELARLTFGAGMLVLIFVLSQSAVRVLLDR